MLRASVPEVRDAKDLDEKFGVCRKEFSEGRLGDTPGSIEGWPEIDRFFADASVDPHKGDTVVLVASLREVAPPRSGADLGGRSGD